ncbi:MAG TPA: hypothetical protein VNM66_09620 [Thermodesulfobacteriota bacterium]|nr:hypothetical protein [Thermodesulfobacteriota bacterium]
MTGPRRILAGLLALVAAGCASGPWAPAVGRYTSTDHRFSVELPPGWMRLTAAPGLLATTDGLALQQIAVVRLDVGRPLRHTKKTLARDMSPLEAAEVLLDDLAADPAVLAFALEESAPVTVGGLPGFRARFTSKTADGLRLRTLYYGLVAGQWIYVLRYTAAERYYFDKDLAVFEQVVASFRPAAGS